MSRCDQTFDWYPIYLISAVRSCTGSRGPERESKLKLRRTIGQIDFQADARELLLMVEMTSLTHAGICPFVESASLPFRCGGMQCFLCRLKRSTHTSSSSSPFSTDLSMRGFLQCSSGGSVGCKSR